MALAHPDRLDILTRNREGEIELHIISVGDWSPESGMLEQLEVKLANYVAFARSRGYEEEVGPGGQPIVILAANHDLSPAAEDVLRRASAESGMPMYVERYDPFGPEETEPRTRVRIS